MASVDLSAESYSITERRLLLTVSLVTSLIMLDSNIVAVALPSMGRALGASFAGIQWVISAYVLSYTALLMAAGTFSDLYGRRRAMLAGLAIFGLASIACGFSQTATALNIARAAQGVGGALLLTASLAILTHAFGGSKRTEAFAFWGASIGIAMAMGPIAGGIITHYFGWRWVFLINPPLCAVLILKAFNVVEESRDAQARRFDFAGVASFSAGLALLIWALIDGNDVGWLSPYTLSRLAGAAALFGLFLFGEIRQQRPMIDFELFKRPTFLGAVFAMVGYGAAAQVMIFFLPMFLQNTYHLAPLPAGLAMIPFALPMVLAPKYATRLSGRFSGRALLTAGLAIVCFGDALFWAMARNDLAYPFFAFSMVVAGCGSGLLNGLTVKVLQSAVPANRAGMASGIASTTRYIGILVSVAGLGAILSNVSRNHFLMAADTVGLAPTASDVAARHVASGDLDSFLATLPASLHGPLYSAGISSFARGFSAASLAASVIALIAGVLTCVLIRREDTAPIVSLPRPPCKMIDCRDPF